MKTIIATIALLTLVGCGTVEEIPANDDAQNPPKADSGNAGMVTTAPGTGGTMMPAPTSDGSTNTETKPTTDGNSTDTMLTTDQIIAELKVVPPGVVFVIGNPQDFLGAKFGFETWNFPIGKKCVNSRYGADTALIWLNGQWQLSGPRMMGNSIVNNAVLVSRIATSDELAAANVAMTNAMTPNFPPLTIDLWKVKHKDTLDADIAKMNSSSSSPLICTDP